MFLVSVLRNALLVLVPLSLILSSYLYLYPIAHLCAFPAPEQDASTAFRNTVRQHIPFSSPDGSKIAPFRLLSLGDPQLEGDSSIPDPQAAHFPHLSKFWKDSLLLGGRKHTPLQRLRHSLHDLIDFYLDDIPKAFAVYRKRLDHIGNDYYLGHIYRTLHWWTKPTHVTVLGDLVGSQWIDDAEFESRGWRFWKRVFRGGIKVDDEIASDPVQDFHDIRILGDDAAAWKKRIINVAGNHDIGYAGDLSKERMERFTRVFGKPNYEMRFQLPMNNTSTKEIFVEGGGIVLEELPVPELRIIVLNDMNLDTPAGSKELQDETYQFLNNIITASRDVARPAHFTLVLTHIPMYKDAGICVDGPFFDFFGKDFANGVKEQNHLSRDASKGFLEGIFGMSGNPGVSGQGFGRNGLVMNGHDHEGCDTYHYINQSMQPDPVWEATRWPNAVNSNLENEPGLPGIREITVRSMMGDFAGNAGLLSLWFDKEDWEWQFEFVNCGLGKQHLWWVIHVLDLVTLGVGIVFGILVAVQKLLQTCGPQLYINNIGKRFGDDGSSKGKRKTIKGSKEGSIDPTVVDFLRTNGKLEIPGAGKKSLRRKRSKMNLNGSSSNVSTASTK